MTIKEAQDIIKKIPDYCEWDLKYNEAEGVVRKAIKDGYQLCKVDEIIKELEERKELSDINEIAGLIYERVYESCIKLIKEACE